MKFGIICSEFKKCESEILFSSMRWKSTKNHQRGGESSKNVEILNVTFLFVQVLLQFY